MNFLGFDVSPYKRPVIVAEISCNHEQDRDSAFTHMREAKLAGADIVKIQAYTADEMVADKNYTIKGGLWEGKNLYDLYSKTSTLLEWLPGLFNYAKEIDIPLFSSVFGLESLEALERANCPAYKIASFEIGDLELIREVQKCKKPIVVSTGCAVEGEIERIENINILMHCVSKYPTEFRLSELRKIVELQYRYTTPIEFGYSDHTKSAVSAQMAYALGVNIFEKHFSLSPTSEDAAFSLNKYEFANYVRDLHAAADAYNIQTNPNDQFKRSLYVVKDIQKGEVFNSYTVQARRPNKGIPPNLMHLIKGAKAKNFIPAGTPLTGDLYE